MASHDKPTVSIEGKKTATATTGVFSTFDSGYYFDDPLLYYDRMYPGTTEHTFADQPEIQSSKIA